jgi:S1-C subfamily serine protease
MAMARTSKKDVAAPAATGRGRPRKTTGAGAGTTIPGPEAPRRQPEEARAAEEALREARRELSAAQAELAETRRQLQEAAQQFLREFQEQLSRARQELREAARPREQAAPPAEAEAKDRLGVTVDPGVVVAEVLPGSPAAATGLARGDVIRAVNGEAVHSGEELRRAVAPLVERAEVALQVSRGGKARKLRARLDEPPEEP